MDYHQWTREHELNLPEPVPVDTVNYVTFEGKSVKVGIGIHDSSASLAPYFSDNNKFILISTGTWCINMNPFNDENLTAKQLDQDCLCYLSINRQPVKSSRLFLGHLHDVSVKKITDHFKITDDYYKKIKADKYLLSIIKAKYKERNVFFQTGSDSRNLKDHIDMYEFTSPEEAYHQLMNELCLLVQEAINLIIPLKDETSNMYITGGFSKNELFCTLIKEAFPLKKVYTSEIANASALGAAMVISGSKKSPDLALTECI